MLERVKERFVSFGYVLKEGDDALMAFSVQKAEDTVKDDCNVVSIPDGLMHIAVDMAAGEFLAAKKAFSPGDIAGLDLDYAVKQIQEGDTNTVFAVGEGSLTPEQRLDNFLNCLLGRGREEFSCYRRFRW